MFEQLINGRAREGDFLVLDKVAKKILLAVSYVEPVYHNHDTYMSFGFTWDELLNMDIIAEYKNIKIVFYGA